MKQQNGFTFIELILYISVFSVLTTTLVMFAITTISASTKNVVQQNTSSAVRLLTEKIKYEIRNAQGINTGTSNFGVNLASNSSYQLSLVGMTPNDPIIINVVGGIAQIKYGANAAVALNATNTKITDLTFKNNSSGDSKTKNITFTLTLATSYTGTKQEYKDTINVRNSVEIRKN